MKPIDFYRQENQVLKAIYLLGLIAFGIHLLSIFEIIEPISKYISAYAYLTLSIFFFRLAFYQFSAEKNK